MKRTNNVQNQPAKQQKKEFNPELRIPLLTVEVDRIVLQPIERTDNGFRCELVYMVDGKPHLLIVVFTMKAPFGAGQYKNTDGTIAKDWTMPLGPPEVHLNRTTGKFENIEGDYAAIYAKLKEIDDHVEVLSRAQNKAVAKYNRLIRASREHEDEVINEVEVFTAREDQMIRTKLFQFPQTHEKTPLKVRTTFLKTDKKTPLTFEEALPLMKGCDATYHVCLPSVFFSPAMGRSLKATINHLVFNKYGGGEQQRPLPGVVTGPGITYTEEEKEAVDENTNIPLMFFPGND